MTIISQRLSPPRADTRSLYTCAAQTPRLQASRQQGRLVETVLHIVDVSGCSLKTHLSATARELFSRIANVSDVCYPETLGKLIIVNTSKVRRRLMVFVSSFRSIFLPPCVPFAAFEFALLREHAT